MTANLLIRKKLNIRRGGKSSPICGRRHSFTRNSLAMLFNEIGYKTGAEVGVRRGDYAKVLCDSIPGLKYYGIDNWFIRDRYYHSTIALLSPYDATLIKKDSIDAAREFAPGSLDFVYIDAAHDFDNVMMDIVLWSKAVRPGGIVSGHDYFHSDKLGVIEATHAYANAHGISEWYLTTDGDSAITKSWFWVKP